MSGVEHAASPDFLKQHHQLARRRHVFVASAGRFNVNHAPPQVRLGEAQARNLRVDVVHSRAVDQDVGRAVVTQHHHESSHITKRHGYCAVAEHVQDGVGVAGRQLALSNRMLFVERECALLVLAH